MMDLREKISEGRKLVESKNYVRVVSHHDVDGISAAAIITNNLRSQKKGFRCSLLKNVNGELEEILAEDNELLIVCDMGSSHIEAVEAAGRHVIILDHHQPIRESRSDMVLQINAHMHGINGSAEACAATMAYAFAGDMNLISFMISGALGDRQGTEFKGLNRKLVDEAVEKGIVKVSMGLTMDCYDRKNLQRIIASSMAPFFRGISGRDDRAKDVAKMLEGKSQKTVNSFLLSLLMDQGCREDVIDDLLGYTYSLPFMGLNSQELLSLLNVCDGFDMAEKGLAMALGDKASYDEIVRQRDQYYKKALKGLVALEEKGATKMGALQYFHNEDLGMSGLYCGIGMRYILDQRLPAFVLTRTKDHLKVSARGTRYLINRGLNLAAAMRDAAEKCGGSGGGHDIAAGATLPLENEKKFLEETERILRGQLRL